LASRRVIVLSLVDFNQDGKTDIVLQNNNGAVAVWDMDGFAISHSSTPADPGPAWSVTGDGRHSSHT
jgi:FG-GAP repeat